MEIGLQNISKQFSQFKALDSVSLQIGSGELIALLGPSGSGKTTLLRIIAGLEFADSGAVRFNGENVASTPLRERRIGFVFQHYALFKHMTIHDNISFGLRIRKGPARLPDSQIRKRTDRLLELVQLNGLARRYPHQLSGGQRQRVALARALAIEPRVLLLDEPFGALDAKVRKELRSWLRDLHHQTGVTTLFVTHDQEEALELADRIVIMNGGRIVQTGAVDEVYERPATPMVFDFLGSTNRIPAFQQYQHLIIQDQVVAPYHGNQTGWVTIYVRPGDLRILEDDGPGLSVKVVKVHRTGPIVRATVELLATKQLLTVELPHLHHDVQYFVAERQCRLRLAQFSVYSQVETELPATTLSPLLSGRERLRLAQ